MPQVQRPRSRAGRILTVCALASLICLTLTGCITTADGTTTNVFVLLIVRPFAYILRTIYHLIGSYGWSIILFQLLAKLLLLPLSIKSKKGTNDMQRLQPKMQELEKRYKNDKAKYQEELQKLYKAEGASPLGGCLPSLATLPVMFGLYWPISQPLTYLMSLTAAQIVQIKEILGFATTGAVSEIAVAQAMFVNFAKISHISANIIPIDFTFLGMNLGAIPNWRVFNLLFLIPIISGATSLAMTKIMATLQYRSTGTMPASQNATMTYMMPLVSVWFGFTLPAGLGVYWIAGNVLSIAQEYYLFYLFEKKKAKAAAAPQAGDKPPILQPQKEAAKPYVQKSGSKRKKH